MRNVRNRAPVRNWQSTPLGRFAVLAGDRRRLTYAARWINNRFHPGSGSLAALHADLAGYPSEEVDNG